ncbi:MAG: NADH-quinone oxidoreductase subunit N [Reichenbachiella sp.]
MNELTFNSKVTTLVGEFGYLLPEFCLIVGSLLMVIIELLLPDKKAGLKTAYVLLVLMITAWAVSVVKVDGDFLNGVLHQNNVIRTFKYVFLATTAAILLFPGSWSLRKRGEYFYLVLMIVLGAFFLIQSNNLLLFYVSLELISITSYVLITFSFSRKGFEAGIKYLLFGALASGLMLYGMSLMYGLTGSLEIDGMITEIIVQSEWINIATLLFFVGILFKLALIPMHIWSPDAYEAGPSAVIALISTLPKIAVLLFVFHFIEVGNYDLLQYNWQALLSAVAIGSLFIGNLSALRQNNIKRMMAYSSIAHSGVLVIGLIVGTAFAYQAMLFYAVVYAIMNVGAFYFADWMEE